MRLSTRSRYAIVAVVDMARRKKSEPVTLAELATIQGISISYLEQIFSLLKKSGIVVSVRGPGGGYIIADPEFQIYMSDIVKAIDPTYGQIEASQNHGHMEVFWNAFHVHSVKFLESVKLADVVAEDISIV